MCTDADSRPPAPPSSGQLGDSTARSLTAADGSAFAVQVATTSAEDAPGVVILPDVRGLHPFYADLAEATAGAGIHAVAIDFYGRTAGPHMRGEDFDPAPHRQVARDAGLRLDVAAAAEALHDAGAARVVVWGFCFGGRGAFLQASAPGVDGVIGCYGWPTRVEEDGTSPELEARAGRVRAPVLAVYGGADEKITPAVRDAYDDALRQSGATFETVVYPGAPHSFFDKKMADHADACADLWRRVLDFVTAA
ncbi:MAG: dienelactone hydrolase family protein [Euzebyales bacterium]|nr:dienelactone hydrolase family protein [Euzebyales bacterium]